MNPFKDRVLLIALVILAVGILQVIGIIGSGWWAVAIGGSIVFLKWYARKRRRTAPAQ